MNSDKILISHRGNLDQKVIKLENHPDYIDNALSAGFNVEVDLRYNGGFFLGHDSPEYLVTESWLLSRADSLWVHCKNIKAIEIFFQSDFHFFWHQLDTLTLTSKGYIWAYPGNQPIRNSIAVMPELNNDILDCCVGICSDFIKRYI